MISLNIISQELKKEIKILGIYKSLKQFFYIIIILLCSYSIILLIGLLILNINFIETMADASRITKTSENYSNIIRDINNQITNIDDAQKDIIFTTLLVDYILKNNKNNISINKLYFDKSKNLIQITGQAPARDDLIEFKKIFGNEIYFHPGEFPITSYLEKNNVPFTLDITIKSYEFNKLQPITD